MIRITIELISAVDQSRSRPLGVAVIANDETGTEQMGHYTAMFSTGPDNNSAPVRVKNFPRKQRSAWELLRRVLNEAKLR